MIKYCPTSIIIKVVEMPAFEEDTNREAGMLSSTEAKEKLEKFLKESKKDE